MKFSESWLREWVNPPISREALCEALTMAGLEVETAEPASSVFSGIVVGQVLKVAAHPDAEQLHICQVNAGGPQSLTIVCGAQNVREGMKIPVALIGAILPDNKHIRATTIRGAASEGMLCSAAELGLSDDQQGLFELPQAASIGQDLRSYLQLEDYVIDVSITPNRGDCLSIRGLAREVSALTKTTLSSSAKSEAVIRAKAGIQVTLQAESACPRYVGCAIRHVKADAPTPVWMKERLRRGGIRSINAIVDVTNYVMLELGQPMHAFDLETIQQGIVIRESKMGEKIALLDGTEKKLDAETLIIADAERPLAIAGVMGGMDSGVTLLTKHIFLESAYFTPSVVARQRQYYDLNSDSAYRFERGVDPTMQREAMERAVQLILDIAGGEASELIEQASTSTLPAPVMITLSQQQLTNVLGISIDEQAVNEIFDRLCFKYQKNKTYWEISVPRYRTDIALPEDIIEEIARLYGYDNIPAHALTATLSAANAAGNSHHWHPLRQVMRDQGYHEIISYSFVDQKWQTLFDPQEKPRELINPITADMTVMRTNLWSGLAGALAYNKNRQQHRVRLFETGTCFVTRAGLIEEVPRLGGLVTGLATQEQWGETPGPVDFYDVKGDIESILLLHYPREAIQFKAESHPALQPGQSAGIYLFDQKVGIMGAIHPVVVKSLDLPKEQAGKIYLFEIDLKLLEKSGLPLFEPVSRYPEIRRDLAILVNETITAKQIQDTIISNAGDWLKDVFIFDVYQGKGISPGLKSIALALILQSTTRTLIDDDVTKLVEKVVTALKGNLGAELRS